MTKNSFIGLTVLVSALSFAIVFAVIAISNPTFLSVQAVALLTLLGTVLGAIAALAGFKDVAGLLKLPFGKFEFKIGGRSPTSEDISEKHTEENVMLEYRVGVLEGTINWMLYNGTFSKNISPEEMQTIHKHALELVQRRYPEATISFDGKWQR